MNNNITLVGHVGTEPTSKTFEDTGSQVVKFRLAVKDFSSRKDEDDAMWIDVDAWNGLGERVLQTMTIGREVVINGRLSIQTYIKKVKGEEVKMKNPVVKLTSFHLCGKKPEASNEQSPEEIKAEELEELLT